MPESAAETNGERFLVTGGTGCIGSWVVRNLVREAVPVVVVTSSARLDRLRLILTAAELERITFVRADLTDPGALERAAHEHGVNRVIHLAALQFPFCAADPIEGARVNVVGTVSVLEMARQLGSGRVIYASSAAVYGPKTHYRDAVLGPDAPLHPTSHYGVYKVANELSARVYWQNHGLSSIGIRPHSVYGPGRDQGVTSKPTVAMIAAAAGRPYHIDFGGRYQFQFADDVARVFVRAARASFEGAEVLNVGGSVYSVEAIVRAIEDAAPGARGTITFGDTPLAFPEAFDRAAIDAVLGVEPETPLEEGVRATIDCYRTAVANGTIERADLDRILV